MRGIADLLRVILSRAVGSLGNFLLLVVIGRIFGPAATGLFFFALSLGLIVAQVGNLGLSRFILRGERVESVGSNADALKAFGASVAVVVFIIGGLIALIARNMVDDSNFWISLTAGLLVSASLLFNVIVADLLKVQSRPGFALWVENSILPWAILLVAVLVSGFASAEIVPVMVLLISSFALTLALNLFPIGGSVRAGSEAIGSLGGVLWLRKRQMVVFWATGATVMLSSRIAGASSPLLLSAEEIGLLAAGTGITSLGGTILQASQAYFAPRMSSAYNRIDYVALRNELLISCLFTTALFAPIFIIAFGWPSTVMALFGDGFAENGSLVLQIMIVGQAVRMLSGNSEIFLSMVDRGAAEFAVVVISVLVFVGVVTIATHIEPASRVAWAYAAMLACRGTLSSLLSAYVLYSYSEKV